MKAMMYLQNNDYDLKNCSEIIALLVLFLTNEIGVSSSKCDDLKKWLKDARYTGRGGNVTFLEKCGDSILISEDWAEEDDPKFIILKKEFLHILDEWEKVCKERPQEVTIIREGDTFRFKKMF